MICRPYGPSPTFRHYSLGFKAFHSAAATLAGIETAHMIRKGQLVQKGIPPFKQFADLAA
jgi:putative transposase